MLLLVAALAQIEGNADFAERYWPLLTKWAEYLEGQGLRPREPALHRRLRRPPRAQRQPVDQGDPRAGRLREARRHDAATRRRRPPTGRSPRTSLQASGPRWPTTAITTGWRSTSPGTWSQKYNLVWDRAPRARTCSRRKSRARRSPTTRRCRNRYGLPLDNRERYTKLDWIVWTATLADAAADFEALIEPVYRFLQRDAQPRADDRLVLDARTAKQRGFQARSVVGGVFIKMLADPAIVEEVGGCRAGTLTIRRRPKPRRSAP